MRLFLVVSVALLGACGTSSHPSHSDAGAADLSFPDLSWTAQTAPTPKVDFTTVWSAGSDVFVGGATTLLHSGDQGAHWAVVNSQVAVTSLSGSSANDLYAAGGEIFSHLTNLGTMAQPIDPQFPSTPPTFAYSQVWYSPFYQSAFAVGAFYVVSSTMKASGECAFLRAIWGDGPELFVVATGGTSSNVWGISYGSLDSNNNLTYQLPRPKSPLAGAPSAIWGSSATDIYVVGSTAQGAGLIAHSSDRFQTAPQIQTLETQGGTTLTLTGIWGSGANDIYIVGKRLLASATTQGVIEHSSDGGQSWRETSLGQHGLNAIWGTGPRDIYIVGDQGTIYHSGS